MSNGLRHGRPLRWARAASWRAVAVVVSTAALVLADVRLGFGHDGVATWTVEVGAVASLALSLTAIRRHRGLRANGHIRNAASRTRCVSRSRPAQGDTR